MLNNTKTKSDKELLKKTKSVEAMAKKLAAQKNTTDKLTAEIKALNNKIKPLMKEQEKFRQAEIKATKAHKAQLEKV